MTTIAYDGNTMVADTLAVDSWGLRERSVKIWSNPHVIIGGAGESGQINRWWFTLDQDTVLSDLLTAGYAPYVKDNNDPSLIIVDRSTGRILRHAGGAFVPVSRTFHAVGSGRDFALAAMHLGHTAKDAVLLASKFDNNTGSDLTIMPRHV